MMATPCLVRDGAKRSSSFTVCRRPHVVQPTPAFLLTVTQSPTGRLGQDLPAVEHDVVAGDEAGLIGREIEKGVGHVLRIA